MNILKRKQLSIGLVTLLAVSGYLIMVGYNINARNRFNRCQILYTGIEKTNTCRENTDPDCRSTFGHSCPYPLLKRVNNIWLPQIN